MNNVKFFKILSVLFVFCFVFTLSACDYNKYSNIDTGDKTENSASDSEEDTNFNEDEERRTMKIKINDTIFEVMLEDNSTAKSFCNMLPQSLNMNELNGNEKYCYINSSLPTNSTRINTITAGDIMLWGNNCIVIFYETFSSGYSYSKIGKIVDTTNLKQCLGSGSVLVNFIK